MSPDLEEIERVLAEADCLADAATVEAAIDRLADEITSRLGGRNPVVYVVMNGGLIFAGSLLPRLPFPLELGYVHASRYGKALEGAKLHWRVAPTLDPRDRSVLIVDDILDEGHTLEAIREELEQAGAREVLSVVLVHKVHERKASPGLRADFSGLDIVDRYLFGYGMDYKGYWRNAAGIFAVKGL